MKKTILFNKETGTHFATFESGDFSNDGVDGDLFLIKEVELADDEFWYGDYETGQVYNSKEIQIVSQRAVRDATINKIFSQYSSISQTKVILDQLKEFIPEENQTQEFKDMVAFIDEARAEYKLKKEAFSSNPEVYIWVSDEDAAEQVSNRYSGLI